MVRVDLFGPRRIRFVDADVISEIELEDDGLFGFDLHLDQAAEKDRACLPDKASFSMPTLGFSRQVAVFFVDP